MTIDEQLVTFREAPAHLGIYVCLQNQENME